MRRNKLGYQIHDDANLFAGTAYSIDRETGEKVPLKLRLPENLQFASELKQLNESVKNDPESAEQKLYQLQLKHYNRCLAKRQAVGAELSKIRKRWEQDHREDPAAALLRMERHKARAEVMPEDDLAELMSGAREADTPEKRAAYDPDMLLAAAAVLQRRGKTYEASLLPGALENINSEAPWLNTQEGAQLAELDQLYSVEFGCVKTDVSGIAQQYVIAELVEVE